MKGDFFILSSKDHVPRGWHWDRDPDAINCIYWSWEEWKRGTLGERFYCRYIKEVLNSQEVKNSLTPVICVRNKDSHVTIRLFVTIVCPWTSTSSGIL